MRNLFIYISLAIVTIVSIWLYYGKIDNANTDFAIPSYQDNKAKSIDISKNKNIKQNTFSSIDSNKIIPKEAINITTKSEIEKELKKVNLEDNNYKTLIANANEAFDSLDENINSISNDLKEYESDLIALNRDSENSFEESEFNKYEDVSKVKQELSMQRKRDLNRLKAISKEEDGL